jgi:hypothetical protein
MKKTNNIKELALTANLDLDCNKSKLEKYIESGATLRFNLPRPPSAEAAITS